MAGCDRKDGYYIERYITDEEIWEAFSRLFSAQSRNDSSYKFGFLKSILDNLYNVDDKLVLTFDQIFSKFAEIYWSLIVNHQLKQRVQTKSGTKTHIEKILEKAKEDNHIIEIIRYENLSEDIRVELEHNVKQKCKTYVVGALFEDTNEIFYSFSKNEEWLKINPLVYNFLCRNKVLIEKLNYYEWARFLEKVNTDRESYKLLSEIDKSTKRNNLSYYRNILYDEFETRTCFYCGRKLDLTKTDVDHFIPWSFIKDDNLWNLVLSCSQCNKNKNDRLADNLFLMKLIDRNREIQRTQESPLISENQIRILKPAYEWAISNGYNRIWRPVADRETPKP